VFVKHKHTLQTEDLNWYMSHTELIFCPEVTTELKTVLVLHLVVISSILYIILFKGISMHIHTFMKGFTYIF
jgi:hypothetical protein